MTKAKVGVMQLQAKEHQRWLVRHGNLGGGKQGCLYRFQRKHGPVNTLISGL